MQGERDRRAPRPFPWDDGNGPLQRRHALHRSWHLRRERQLRGRSLSTERRLPAFGFHRLRVAGPPIVRTYLRAGLGLRCPLHRLDLLFHWLESGSEHGGGQLGYVAAIADSGFNALLDEPLL